MTQGFSGVGKVQLYTRVNNLRGIGTHLGNCPKLEIRFAPQTVEKKSSMDTARSPLRRMTSATEATISLACDEFNKRNAATFFAGRVDEVAASGTTINHTWPTGVVVGDVLGVPQTGLATQTITDSTGSPKTLTLGTNYSQDLFSGEITILDLTTGGPYVQPLKSAHTQAAVTVIAGLTITTSELWLSMAGTNADNNLRGVLDAYRVRLDPAQVFQFINEGYQDMEIQGAALQDTTKLVAAVGGQVFKFSLPSTHE